jgi:hypothetical protein
MQEFAGSTAGVRLVARLAPIALGLTRKFRLAILSAGRMCRNTPPSFNFAKGYDKRSLFHHAGGGGLSPEGFAHRHRTAGGTLSLPKPVRAFTLHRRCITLPTAFPALSIAGRVSESGSRAESE